MRNLLNIKNTLYTFQKSSNYVKLLQILKMSYTGKKGKIVWFIIITITIFRLENCNHYNNKDYMSYCKRRLLLLVKCKVYKAENNSSEEKLHSSLRHFKSAECNHHKKFNSLLSAANIGLFQHFLIKCYICSL